MITVRRRRRCAYCLPIGCDAAIGSRLGHRWPTRHQFDQSSLLLLDGIRSNKRPLIEYPLFIAELWAHDSLCVVTLHHFITNTATSRNVKHTKKCGVDDFNWERIL